MNTSYSSLTEGASSLETAIPSSKRETSSVHRRPKWQTIILRGIALPCSILSISMIPILLILAAAYTGDPQTSCSTLMLSKESLLAPDILFGNFTITQARSVDLTWNLAAGRGLQAAVGLMTYKVANAALLRLAEVEPLSYRTFEAVSIRSLSFSAIWPLARAVLNTGGWRAKVTFVVLLLSAVFILVLPTLNDVMTGYVQSESLYWQFPNGTLGPNSSDSGACNLCAGDPEDCLFGPSDCVSWVIGTRVCIPETGYQWGFSTIWTIVLTCSLFIWGWAIFGIWVDADRFSVLYRRGRILGTWRTITDLGGVLKQDIGSRLSMYSNAELEKEVDTALPVMYIVKRDSGGAVEDVILSRPTSKS